MKRLGPAAAGHPPGAPLEPFGGVARARVADAEHLEIWRLPPEVDDARVTELEALGAQGATGVIDAGRDAEGAWLVVRRPVTRLSDRLRGDHAPWAARDALSLGREVAEALAVCESTKRFPGPLTAEGVGLDAEGRAFLIAAPIVEEALGAAPDRADDPAPLYTPPRQLEGAPWDEAANRWGVSLLVYRMLAGAHPLAGLGLRRALDAASRGEFPPFAEEVARALPAGVTSLVLRELSPQGGLASADALADALARFAPPVGAAFGAGASAVRRVRKAAEVPPAAPPPREPAPRSSPPGAAGPAAGAAAGAASRSRTWLQRLVPLGLGLGVAGAAFAALEPAAPPVERRARVDAEAPLSPLETDAASCASCHPRQAAEWRRSVMGHAVKSPLFNALESLIEEQVGRDQDCPNGAGILRKTNAAVACRDPQSGVAVSGSGGEHWCVNCHAPTESLEPTIPAWQGKPGGDPRSRLPVRDMLGERAMEGISCGFCHQVHGPVAPRGGYQGNPTWTSTLSGATFAMRPEDRRGLFGIANSGYDLDPASFLSRSLEPGTRVHQPTPPDARRYLASSEFCGSCHDVRLFGSDAILGARGEHFKRLRNAYSEWDAWAATERRAGREPATCQDCHMTTYPGVCEPAPGEKAAGGCPDGTRFSARAPGAKGEGLVSTSSRDAVPVSTHYFSGVDLPLANDYPDDLLGEEALDTARVPIGARARRDLLLARSLRLALGPGRVSGRTLEIPVELENVGGGHRVPAGFSQEREFWVHLRVTDARGRVVYEVGRVDRPAEDLRDKVFSRVATNPSVLDERGRPVGLFGADVRDGPDVPRWSPPPDLGGTRFRGQGLVNLQNGFLRCVRCIGVLTPDGRCEPGPGQGLFRADRFADGDYDQDTGTCRSNLSGHAALFETYFPVGALDSTRGLPKAPDAIIDTRSAPPGVPLTYVYALDTAGARPPFRAEARLLFRAFPPFLIAAFADYEREMTRLGKRPSGPLVDRRMLERLEIVEIARQELEIR